MPVLTSRKSEVARKGLNILCVVGTEENWLQNRVIRNFILALVKGALGLGKTFSAREGNHINSTGIPNHLIGKTWSWPRAASPYEELVPSKRASRLSSQTWYSEGTLNSILTSAGTTKGGYISTPVFISCFYPHKDYQDLINEEEYGDRMNLGMLQNLKISETYKPFGSGTLGKLLSLTLNKSS